MEREIKLKERERKITKLKGGERPKLKERERTKLRGREQK